jgi:aryl-phospho-beta-D-glucosidase BglC (GH1 family)
VNGNGTVDIADLSILLSHYGSGVPVAGAGWLHTDGTVLKDGSGTEVQLHGAELLGTVSDDDIAKMQQAGFNHARFNINWEKLEPAVPTVNGDGTLNHTWDPTYLSNLDTYLNKLAAAHIRVILEMHQSQWSSKFAKVYTGAVGLPPWLYPDATDHLQTQHDWAKCEFFKDLGRPGVPGLPQELQLDAWKEIVNRYKNNDYVVGIDILNEPGWPPNPPLDPGTCDPLPTSAQLLTYFNKIGGAINTVNPKLLIAYENGAPGNAPAGRVPLCNNVSGLVNWCTAPDPSTYKVSFNNAVLSWHYYPDNNNWPASGGCPPGTPGYPCPPTQAHLDNYFGYLADEKNIANGWSQPFWLGEFNGYNEGYSAIKNREFNMTDTATGQPYWKVLTERQMAYTKANHISWNYWSFQSGAGRFLHCPNPDTSGLCVSDGPDVPSYAPGDLKTFITDVFAEGY